MATQNPPSDAAGAIPRRLLFYNTGFLRQPRLRRILALSGHSLHFGHLKLGPKPGDGVAVWGHSPYAKHGEGIAAKHHAPLIRLEDAFLRSIRPGRMGDAPLGLLIDPYGVHFDPTTPSALERILTHHPLDDSNLLLRARDGIARLQALHLSKYNIHDPDLPAPRPGYVLVIDQTVGDASIQYSGAKPSTFREMLVFAQEENPGARIVIKTHPETTQGLRPGHYTAADATENITLLTDQISPWTLLDGAIAVYTVSSQLGFEAVLAGHRPRVFGQPFYAGWGLSADENPVPRRRRTLTRAQLFAAAMLLAPTWYDPCRDRLCSFEDTVNQLEAEVRAYREDRHGHIATGMRAWKRHRLQAVFGREKPLKFVRDPVKALNLAATTGRGLLIWAGKEPADLAQRATDIRLPQNQLETPPSIPQSPKPAPNTHAPAMAFPPKNSHSTPVLRRIEDGFLRSRGLGANLIPPLSLVADDLGIYYDPTRPSRLESLIRAPLPPGGTLRITKLIEKLTAAGLSKYNINSVGLSSIGLNSVGPNAPAASPNILAASPVAAPSQNTRTTMLDSDNKPAVGITLPLPTHLPPGTRLAQTAQPVGHATSTLDLATSPVGTASTQKTHRILIPGQVEDDASIRLGADDICTNLGLIRATRDANPDALLIYKPHPDVEAGLRPGAIAPETLSNLVNIVAANADPIALLANIDAVWTMTSLLGFEALLRGKPVTCLGAPFYAGWGLTRDLGAMPNRRRHAPDGHPLPRVDLASLAYATLIAYPRYYDPISRRPCPPEVIIDRLTLGPLPKPGPFNRAIAKLQGHFASYAHLWRR